MCYKIHKLINSVWNEDEFPVERKESIIVPTYKKGDKTDCSNYRGISLLSTTYKMSSKILLVKVNSKYRRHNWGSSMWISTQQVNYWSYILHSANIWEKMGIKQNNASALYRLQKSLWFCKEGGLV